MDRKVPKPANEAERLEALASYKQMGTPPEMDFDGIARIASEICQTPISLITLMGEEVQWFKSHYGTEVTQNARDLSFCAYTILQPGRPLVVPDARLDERFRENPLTTGPTQVIFYAGVPLVNPEGFALGTLCVIDQKPNELTEKQLETLQALATTVSQLFELRRKVRHLEIARKKLEDANQEVSEMAYVLSHDLKSPLNSIVSLLEVVREENGSQMDESGQELLAMLHESATNLSNITKGTIQYFNTTRSQLEMHGKVNIHEMMMALLTLLRPPASVNINYPTNLPDITTSKVALQHILSNLLDNAIKYSDKEICEISIEFSETDKDYRFSVTDNGPGIEQRHQEKVFKLFQTLGRTDRHGNRGTGLGLAIVRRMVEKFGGSISIHSPAGGGTCFHFSLMKKPE